MGQLPLPWSISYKTRMTAPTPGAVVRINEITWEEPSALWDTHARKEGLSITFAHLLPIAFHVTDEASLSPLKDLLLGPCPQPPCSTSALRVSFICSQTCVCQLGLLLQ